MPPRRCTSPTHRRGLAQPPWCAAYRKWSMDVLLQGFNFNSGNGRSQSHGRLEIGFTTGHETKCIILAQVGECFAVLYTQILSQQFWKEGSWLIDREMHTRSLWQDGAPFFAHVYASVWKRCILYIYICVWRWNQINKCTNAPILSNVFVETITNSQSQSHQVARELLVRQACKTLFPFTWPQGQAQSSLALRQKLMEADTASSKNSNWLSQRQLCKTLEFRCNRNQS